jgi:hypothetical protein
MPRNREVGRRIALPFRSRSQLGRVWRPGADRSRARICSRSCFCTPRPTFGFGIEQAGYYRIAVKYVWATGPTAYEWAGKHRTGDSTWGGLFGTDAAYCRYR